MLVVHLIGCRQVSAIYWRQVAIEIALDHLVAVDGAGVPDRARHFNVAVAVGLIGRDEVGVFERRIRKSVAKWIKHRSNIIAIGAVIHAIICECR